MDNTDVERRIAALEAQLAAQVATLRATQMATQTAARIITAAPTDAPPAPRPLPARFIAWMGGELPKLVGAAVLLVLGFALKDSVDLAIKQRQLDLSYSKEMQGLLQKMAEQTEMNALQATAVVLASYGEAALPALLSELRNTGLRADAAEQGLAALALRNPAPVCEALPRVLRLKSRQYDWQIHQKIVRMLGEQDCRDAVKPLHRYRILVDEAANGRPARFEALVRQAPLAPAEEYPRLIRTIDRSLQQLQQED